MINVVYLINQLRNSGPTRVLLDICKYLDRSIYNPIIVSLRADSTDRSIKHKFTELNIEIVEYKYKFWQLELWQKNISRTISNRFAKYQQVIYHAHGYHPNLILSYLRDQTTISTLHCISGESFVMNKGYLLGNYMSIRFRSVLKHIDYPIAISKYMQAYYMGVCDNIQVITNGVDFHIDNSLSKQQYKAKLGYPNQYIVLVSGAFSPGKNQRFIIEELKNTNLSFKCIFIGKGDLLAECKSLVSDDDRFEFKGYVFNVSDYINAADVVISASLSEGMPLAVLETINMGCPILLSNIPPHIEICDNMNGLGVHVFECQTGRLSSLFKKVQLLNEDHNTIAERAYSIYSAENMSKEYQKLYNKAIHSCK